MTVLVVGANGQLGSYVCHELLRRKVQVVGSVRAAERATDLAAAGVEIVLADLTRDEGIRPHLRGVDTVVLSANGATPRAGDEIRQFPTALHQVITDCEQSGVRRFVLVSVPRTPADHGAGYFEVRRSLEAQLQGSSLEATVVRLAPLMDVWLALAGSSLPLRGEPHATVGRPSPVIRRVRRRTGLSVDERRVLYVPGRPDSRIAYLRTKDAAAACAEAAIRRDVGGRTFEVGGPEVLTAREVADRFAAVLGEPVRVRSIPTAVFSMLSTVLRPFGGASAEAARLLRIVSQTETLYAPGGQLVDPAALTTVEQYLAEKAALPDRLPVVP